MSCLFGLKIAVIEQLAGQDRPVMSDDVLLVSPAMWRCMEGATDEELEHVLRNLIPIEIPRVAKWMMTDSRMT